MSWRLRWQAGWQAFKAWQACNREAHARAAPGACCADPKRAHALRKRRD